MSLLPPHLQLWPRPGHLRAVVFLLGVAAVGVAAADLDDRTWYRRRLPVDYSRVEAAREHIDPNTASVASLRRLPGIGPSLGEAIVDYRIQHGPDAFRTAEDLQYVHRIGPGIVAKIRDHLVLPPMRR